MGNYLPESLQKENQTKNQKSRTKKNPQLVIIAHKSDTRVNQRNIVAISTTLLLKCSHLLVLENIFINAEIFNLSSLPIKLPV